MNIKHFGLLELETWLSPTIDYYRTVVGYYRVIAQKTLKLKNSHQDLLKTSKMNKIGSITAENDKNENGRFFFRQKYKGFLVTSDPATIYMLKSEKIFQKFDLSG